MIISSIKSKLIKVYRFFKIYGFSRTYVKIIGRLRIKLLLKFPLTIKIFSAKNIAIIGAGQFSFATIAYFLKLELGNSIYGVYDIDINNANSFVNYYKGEVFTDVDELINNKNVKYVYIASNHASHTEYAIKALNADKIVYIEKPISVNKDQFLSLLNASKGKSIYVGYNRPLSPAIQKVKEYIVKLAERKPLTLNCFIIGHKIPSDHWYRNFEEGTRVCGNMGHWLDLSINLLKVIGLPKFIYVNIQSSNVNEKDDNVVITMTSSSEDLISIMLSSREEPFEGINESINIQYSNIIAKIDDFRRLTIWDQERLIKKRYFRKNVGHQNAVLQPFSSKYTRDFNEVEISTRLMLDITNSIRNDINQFTFEI